MKIDEIDKSLNYMFSTEDDELWGLIVTSVGHQIINRNDSYPPKDHSSDYNSNVEKGRILNEYHLIYITGENDRFSFENEKQTCTISEGKIIVQKPGDRHSYNPDENSECNEYWIGFKGKIIDRIIERGFFENRELVFNIRLNDLILDLFLKAIHIAHEERAGYQQALSGIVMHILGLIYYWDKSKNFDDEELVNKIKKARVIMRESIYKSISIEDISNSLEISYSEFLRAFTDFTGTTPLNYMLELKLNEAKLLLSNSTQSEKEISYALNFENPDYFSTFFKKKTGITAIEYRDKVENQLDNNIFL